MAPMLLRLVWTSERPCRHEVADEEGAAGLDEARVKVHDGVVRRVAHAPPQLALLQHLLPGTYTSQLFSST